MFNSRFLAIVLLTFFTCSSFIILESKSDKNSQSFVLKPHEEFIFGEFTFEKAKFKVYNSSSQELQIKILDQESLEPQAIFPFDPKTTFTAHVFPWEKVLIQNTSDEEVSIVVDAKKLDSGFRIKEMRIHSK